MFFAFFANSCFGRGLALWRGRGHSCGRSPCRSLCLSGSSGVIRIVLINIRQTKGLIVIVGIFDVQSRYLHDDHLVELLRKQYILLTLDLAAPIDDVAGVAGIANEMHHSLLADRIHLVAHQVLVNAVVGVATDALHRDVVDGTVGGAGRCLGEQQLESSECHWDQ